MGGLVRDFFSVIDTAIYSLMTSIYRILMNIADVQIFSQETLKSFSERVYALLAIFMAFKLIFSFINYAVNPDSMTNEKTGGKKLVINIMVSLVLLIAVPGVIFPLSRKLQYAILDEGVLQEIILGVDQTAYSQSRNTIRAGRSMSYAVFSSFFTPAPPSSGQDNEFACTEETIRFFDNGAEGTCDGGVCANDETGLKNLRYQLDGRCATAINNALEGTDVDAEAVVTSYERAYNQFSTKILLGGDGDYNLKRIKMSNGDFLFDYKIVISTIVGFAVGWMLVVFCFQIAVRTIKLGFLELVAPIPILSYIDSKAKSKSFDGWLKTCISAYLDLFVRLAALYFAVFVISSISLGNLTYASNLSSFNSVDGREPVGFIVKLFIIIGALMFAQQVPKLIEDIFGIKLDGTFSINPFKNTPIAAAAVAGGAALVGGTVGGLAANTANLVSKVRSNRKLKNELKAQNPEKTLDPNWRQDERYMKYGGFRGTAGSIIGGMLGGGFRSAVAGGKSKSAIKGIDSGVTASSQSRNLRATGYGFKQRILNKGTDMAGMANIKTGTVDSYDAETKQMKQNLAFLKQNVDSLSQASADLYGKNVTALKGVVDQTNGNWRYQDYASYLSAKLEEVMSENTRKQIEAIEKDTTMNAAQKEANISVLEQKEINIARQQGKMATEDLFDQYKTLHDELATGRESIAKQEKAITIREEARTIPGQKK